MTKIIQIQRYKADPKGFGGSHRIYQNYQDLISFAGELEVGIVENNQVSKGSTNRLYNCHALIKDKMDCLLKGLRVKFDPEELTRSLVFDQIKNANPFGTFPLDVYIQYINAHGKPEVCFLDYPSLVEIARYNNSKGIANIYCPHNLESFYTMVQKTGDPRMAYKSAMQWLTEQEMFSICQESLMISPFEVQFVRSLGLPADEYPYLPVGEVRSALMGIRSERKRVNNEPGLLIMIGTVKQSSTGAGFRWVLDNIRSKGFPKGMHVVVGGIGAEQLLSEYKDVENIELRGWVSQGELEEMMVKSSAVIVPQFSGFGTPTRISEMACAGIPVLTTGHVTSTMKVPPGVTILSDSWDDWVSAMTEAAQCPISNTLEAYEAWEKSLINPIPAILTKYT